MPKKPIIGDVFEIPLSDNKKGFGQYIDLNKYGSLIQVLNITVEDTVIINIDQIMNSGPRFPPLFTGLFAAIKVGMWTVIGNQKVPRFRFPLFASTLYDGKTGKPSMWFIWDGKNSRKVGMKLPRKYQGIEYLIIWDPKTVVKRIETGEYPFPYRELMVENKFTPRNLEND